MFVSASGILPMRNGLSQYLRLVGEYARMYVILSSSLYMSFRFYGCELATMLAYVSANISSTCIHKYPKNCIAETYSFSSM